MRNVKDFFNFIYEGYNGESKLVIINLNTKESNFITLNNDGYKKIEELIKESKLNNHNLFFNVSLQDEEESKKRRLQDNKNKINSRFIINCLKIYDYDYYKKYISMITNETLINEDEELSDEEKKVKVQENRSKYNVKDVLNLHIDWEKMIENPSKKKKLDEYITDFLKYTRGSTYTTTNNFGMWLDVDINIKGHHKNTKNMFTSHKEAKEFLLNLKIKPNILINSGGGYHAYYVFEKTTLFEKDEDRLKHRDLVMKFESYVRQKAKEEQVEGSIDSTNDLARMLRLPYSYNNKNKMAVKKVEVDFFDEKRLSKEEVISFLEENVVESFVKNTSNRKKKTFDKDFLKYNINIKMLDGVTHKTKDNKKIPLSENIYNNCDFVKTIIDNPTDSVYKERLHLIQLLLHTEDYDEYFDKLYEGQSLEKQDRISTTIDEMERRMYPPPTCNTIKENCGFDCSQCPFFNEIHSPISLARRK